MNVKKGVPTPLKGQDLSTQNACARYYFKYNYSVKPLRLPFKAQRLSVYTTRRAKRPFLFHGAGILT